MKKLVITILVIFTSVLCSFGSHLLGGELMIWTDTVGQTTTISTKLSLIRDATGINLYGTQSLIVYENGIFKGQITVTLDPATGNGNYIGNPSISVPVELFDYYGSYVPQDQNAVVRMVFDLCCRPSSVVNIMNPSAEGYYIFSQLDLSQGQNSPLPLFAPLAAYANIGYPFAFSYFTSDPENDSLVFSLDTPMSANGQYVNQYYSPFFFSPLQPPPFTLNAINGMVSGVPDAQSVSAYRIVVEEYRKDNLGQYQLLATHNKDLAVLAVNGSSNSSRTLAPVIGATTLPNGARKIDFLGAQANSFTLSFSSINTNKFSLEGFGGPFEFDAQNISITKDSLTPSTCNFVVTWVAGSQFVRNEPYYFVLRSTHYGFAFDYLFAIALNSSVGLEEVSYAQVIRVFPNPATEKLYLQPIDGVHIPGIVKLLDNLGRTVQLIDLPFKDLTIDLSNLPNGIYFLEINHKEGVQRDKIVKKG